MNRHEHERNESMRLMDRHRDVLLARARAVLAVDPAAQLVGLVVAGDSDAAATLRRFKAEHGEPLPDGADVVELVTRQQALALLRENVPALLDWLESGPDKLPLFCATQHGARLGWTAL